MRDSKSQEPVKCAWCGKDLEAGEYIDFGGELICDECGEQAAETICGDD